MWNNNNILNNRTSDLLSERGGLYWQPPLGKSDHNLIVLKPKQTTDYEVILHSFRKWSLEEAGLLGTTLNTVTVGSCKNHTAQMLSRISAYWWACEQQHRVQDLAQEHSWAGFAYNWTIDLPVFQQFSSSWDKFQFVLETDHLGKFGQRFGYLVLDDAIYILHCANSTCIGDMPDESICCPKTAKQQSNNCK